MRFCSKKDDHGKMRLAPTYCIQSVTDAEPGKEFAYSARVLRIRCVARAANERVFGASTIPVNNWLHLKVRLRKTGQNEHFRNVTEPYEYTSVKVVRMNP